MSARNVLVNLMLILCLLESVEAQCRKAEKNDTVHGANQFILLKGIILTHIHGRIFLPGKAPLKEAIVEIYNYPTRIKEDDLYKLPFAQERIAVCLTDINGMFSFDRLKPGKYLLRAGTRTSEGMNAIHVVVVLNPQHQKSIKNGLELELEPGS